MARGTTEGPIVKFSFSYSRFMRAVMTPMLAGPARSTIRVERDRVVVEMGIGGWAFAATVPKSSIVEVTPVTGPVWGWGAHGWRGRWLVNGSSRGLVRLRLAPSARGRCLLVPLKVRELTLSLTDVEGFVAALQPG